MGGTCGWPALPLPVLTRLTMLSDAQRRAHQQRADAPKVLCQPIEAVGVPRQLARDGGAARHALRARRLEDLGARVARQCGPAAALPPQRDLYQNQAGSLRPAGAPKISSSARSRLRLPQAPASLGQSAAWAVLAGHTGLVFDIEADLEHQYVGRRLVAVTVTAAAAAFVAVIVTAADETERLVAVQVRPEQHCVQPHLGGRGWVVNAAGIGDFGRTSRPHRSLPVGPEQSRGGFRVRSAARSPEAQPREASVVGCGTAKAALSTCRTTPKTPADAAAKSDSPASMSVSPPAEVDVRGPLALLLLYSAPTAASRSSPKPQPVSPMRTE
eukprot:scaffold113496_cov66-Phaeocystis_antarctica.AAC.2